MTDHLKNNDPNTQEKLEEILRWYLASKFYIPQLKNMLKERGLAVSGRKSDLISRLVQADPDGVKEIAIGDLAKSFSVSELRNMLKERGLPASGRKTDLISRLVQADPEGAWQAITVNFVPPQPKGFKRKTRKRVSTKVRGMEKPTLICQSCSRTVGPEIFECPERPENCPYVFFQGANSSVLRTLGVYLIAGSIIIMVIGSLKVGLLFGVVIGLLILALGFDLLFFTQTTKLHDPVTGAMWHRTSLHRIEPYRKMVIPRKTLSLDLDVPGSLEYPPSFTALRTNRTSEIFESALIGLLSQKLIGMRTVLIYKWYFNRQFIPKKVVVEYFLASDETREITTMDGILEKKIMDIVKRERHDSIFNLVRDVYDTDKLNPKHWLIDLVEKDAEFRGLGKRVGIIVRHFELDPVHADRLAEESEVLQTVEDQLYSSQSYFLRVLNESIELGIESRRSRQHSGGG